MQYEKEVRTRIFKLHQLMQRRFGPKYWSRGRRKGEMRDPGRQLPFTRQELLDYVLDTMDDKSVIACPYCRQPIDAMSLSLDHDVPVSRGGGIGLDNLVLCCQSCNRAKGGLTYDEYRDLCVVLDTFDPAAKTDVLSRLKTGSMGIRLRSKQTRATV